MVSFRPRLAAALTPALALCLIATSPAAAADANAPFQKWLAAQPNLQTWSADFTQTRMLKSLTQPLTATGHIWFAAPNQFHWEITSPQQTIAIRQTNVMYVIYPRLKRAERYPLSGATGQWRDTLALLDAGFPRSQAEVESRYNILSITPLDDATEVTLQPKSASARRMMTQIRIGFSTRNNSLRSTELHFADGSILRNDFTNSVINPKVDASVFVPAIPNDFKIVEPLKQK